MTLGPVRRGAALTAESCLAMSAALPRKSPRSKRGGATPRPPRKERRGAKPGGGGRGRRIRWRLGRGPWGYARLKRGRAKEEAKGAESADVTHSLMGEDPDIPDAVVSDLTAVCGGDTFILVIEGR